ncbi:MAG: M23 family metallopeptidase [Hymenobacteraceae bacterium]|nr:M23 family metallopeptidase [Hymenobacteraceae bacterium]MDX5394968.1 M23 family metallopeptidase [Hymenobacteraceae bacterium]MDX5442333.1 M23 family metallopeptidase [Hymenobacteraceae bacterium]MDX5511002.1 M23 family metallopeptidase [Hymenobacteraceae bacterium]
MVVRSVFSACYAILLFAFAACQSKSEVKNQITSDTVTEASIAVEENVKPDSLLFYCQQFDSLNTNIRDNKIDKINAEQQVAELLFKIKHNFRNSTDKLSSEVYFPLSGYTAKAIGGENGNGYKPNGYSFFDGNKHKGHPAHDIFIYDKDQNTLDDVTGNEVSVLSVHAGVVVALSKEWQPDSNLRGGNYIWVYDPVKNLLIYYAHNKSVLVSVGEIVKAGEAIATVGRTGLNAYKKRSPTHLHIMALHVTPDFKLTPTDLYPFLVKGKF